MIAQYRPDIARAVEETVVNLKALEHTLEVLRNDLAWLAQTVGHPQAAQLVLTPSRNLGIGAQGSLGISPQIPGQLQNPYMMPFGAFGPQAAIPSVGVPFASQWGPIQTGNPFAQPGVTNPFQGPIQSTLPYAQLYR